MTIKTAFLAGAAAVLMTSAPALAQDAPASTPPEASAAQPQSLTLAPGATVKGSDGAEIGKLVGVQNNAAGEQEPTVRGADGQVRAVPLPGIRQNGADVVVGWTVAEYQAAPAVSGSTSPAAPAAEPTSPAPSEPSMAPDSSTPPEPTTPQ